MNNKKIGNDFEQALCKKLSEDGWWAHFLNPNASGAQPFDIIAIKDSRVLALDCKTCEMNSFSLARIEDNQRLSFDSLQWKTDAVCGFAILHKGEIYFVNFNDIREAEKIGHRSIKLDERNKLNESLCFK